MFSYFCTPIVVVLIAARGSGNAIGYCGIVCVLPTELKLATTTAVLNITTTATTTATLKYCNNSSGYK